jgi:hypothetical protein
MPAGFFWFALRVTSCATWSDFHSYCVEEIDNFLAAFGRVRAQVIGTHRDPLYGMSIAPLVSQT